MYAIYFYIFPKLVKNLKLIGDRISLNSSLVFEKN